LNHRLRTETWTRKRRRAFVGEAENGLEKKMATTLPTVFVFVMCMTDQHCVVAEPKNTYKTFAECTQQVAVGGPEIIQKNAEANREIKAANGVVLPEVVKVECRPQVADWFIKQLNP
jgi:hypothetical protein